jgi:hypothetical protein
LYPQHDTVLEPWIAQEWAYPAAVAVALVNPLTAVGTNNVVPDGATCFQLL